MKTRKNQHFKQLLAATLAVSSSLGMISPVLAQTTSGEEIKNTATATFTDGTTNPDGTPKTYNATSNEVVITVAEVAGIDITAQTPSISNPNAGAQIYVDFDITNTGNDPTKFFIPSTATLTGTAAAGSTVGTIKIVATDGTLSDIPADRNTPSVAPGGKITVRVPVTVAPGATAGQSINVTLGEIANPADPTKIQNLDRTGNENDAKDVYTVDNPNGQGGETNATDPINGVRESMATSGTITVNARLQAFSTVLKAVSSYITGTNPNDVSDDILTYGLALKVENSSSEAGFVATDLHGTKIKGLDQTKAYVLVSDAIPTGMKLSTTNPTPPNGWQVVYTTDALAINALNATWSTTLPTGTITRIGFVYDTTTSGALAKGTTSSGLNFSVTPDAGFSGQVANIAQTFGQSQPGEVAPGTSTQIVYDESGDQTFNNGLINGANPDSTTAGGISTGEAISSNGTDPGTYDPLKAGTTNPTSTETNKGDTGDTSGENTVFSIAKTPLNGPDDKPEATGPNPANNNTPDNNNDFTNKSIVVPANTPPTATLTDAQTPPITFNNTVQNTSGGSQEITLLPTPPATPGELIDNTKVTITDPATSTSVTYTYTAAGGFTTTSPTPVKVTVTAGGKTNYTVTVDLPAAPQLVGYPVPITAFVDTNKDGLPAGEPGNTTIDRVYTNYLKLEKKARILEADGRDITTGNASTFTTNQSILSTAATPGRIIEYQITYTNISTSGGTNSVILPANNLVITENGTANGNTWFSTTLDPKYPTPAIGSAVGTDVRVQTGANGTVTDINEYKDTVQKVDPGVTGTFTFQRKIK